MQDTVLLLKTLADSKRLLLLQLLQQEQELCVCELGAAMQLSQPLISQLLAKCRQHQLVNGRKEGKWVFYRLAPTLPPWLVQLMTQLPDNDELTTAGERLQRMGDRPERQQRCCNTELS